MWDALGHSFRFRCPASEAAFACVPLSSFRSVDRLSGAAHPAVFQIRFDCALCGDEHAALAAHDELDHAPLAGPLVMSFWDPLTGRVGGDLGHELAQSAADRLRRGTWPWSFWCAAENRLQPGYPSGLRFVARHEQLVGVAVTCASCGSSSLNLVSRRHLDEPFYHDAVVHSLERPATVLDEHERFQRELRTSRFDAHGTDLAA
ncbi:MAG: hypothetical protein ABI317_15305 [Gaiellales bacterium]